VASRRIDLNADAGESFGPWRMGADERLFPHLSSVNVACGFHAGDPVTMGRSVRLARAHGVAVGAHPGFPDTAGFGRRDLAMSEDELHAAVLYQLGALDAFLRGHGERLRHVKAHGALHHRIARDEAAADAVAAAVRDFDRGLPFVVLGGPGGATMRGAAERHGLRPVAEGFPDRAYLPDGRLAPRGVEGAVVADAQRIAARALRMAAEAEVEAIDGSVVRLEVETLCLHGDTPGAHDAAATVRIVLERAGVEVGPF
jgi:UPF0271 protein